MSDVLRSISTQSRSPSPVSIGSKRALSTAAGSDEDDFETTQQQHKRRAQYEQQEEEEGEDSSLGASRLNIRSTPFEGDDDENAEVMTANESSPAASGMSEDEVQTVYPVAPSGSPPDGAAQLDIISNLKTDATSEMQQGEDWYIISRGWFRRWQTACSGVAESKDDDPDVSLADVGPIDNSSILVEGQLKQPVEVGVDVELLPHNAWDFLVAWYGLQQEPIVRPVVSTGGFGSERVEFYPPRFHLLQLLPGTSSNVNVSVPAHPLPPSTTLPSDAPLSKLKEFARESFSLSRKTRFWRLPQPDVDDKPDLEGPAFVHAEKIQAGGSELIDSAQVNDSTTLNDALLTDPDTRLAVEEQLADGKWIIDAEAIQSMPALAIPNAAQDGPSSTSASSDDKRSKSKGMFSSSGGWLESFSNKIHHHHEEGKDHKHHHINILHARSKVKGRPSTPPASANAGPSTSQVLPAAGLPAAGLQGALTRQRAVQDGRQRGLTGLNNLGNTCFMNSALQCMSNTKELQEYFTSGVYRDEINRDNPLGMHGQVAEAFGQLIERLWASSGSSVAPREFKQALSRFAPQFSGYGQQDTQELLAFLLDGVHEDLNRIKKKPATNAPDWHGGGDKELVEMAQTCWDQYRSRNDSVIVDLFQGQYRSTVVCPECDKVSITFDPFMYVTTNLPVVKKWTGKVYFVPLDSSLPRYMIEVEVPKNGTIATLKSAVGKLVDCDPKKMVLTEEYKSKFWKSWWDEEMVTEIQDNDVIIIFEVDQPYVQTRPRVFAKGKEPSASPADDERVLVTVLHRKPARGFSGRGSFGGSSGDLFGTPFLVSLTSEEASSMAGITRAIAKQYARVTTWGAEILEAVEERDTSDAVQDELSGSQTIVDGGSDATAHDASNAVAIGNSSTSVVMPPPPAVIPDQISITAPAASNTEAPIDKPGTQPILFKLSVTRATKASQSGRAYLQGEPNDLVPLERRLPRGPSPDTDMFATGQRTTLPGSFFNNADDDDSSMSTEADAGASPARATDSSSAATDPAAAGAQQGQEVPIELPTSSPALSPLVHTGDCIVADWEPAALEYYFGSTSGAGDRSTWDQVETITDPALDAERRRPKGVPKKAITIQDCLTEFTKEERLGENDTWYCSDCKKHQQATKKVELWKVPDILVFAFKRFGSGRYTRDKIDDFVDFPLENFDMEPFVEGAKVERRLSGQIGEEDPETLIYDLYAVDNHYGGMGGGHYTAYAKNHENGKWYDYDDSRVTEIKDPDSVRTKAAYLVMYRRRTARPIGAKSRELIESAIQSRNASRTASEAGGAPPVLSAPNSPFGSTDNLLALNANNHVPERHSLLVGHTTTDMDDDDDYDAFAPSTVRPDRHFQGIYPRSGISSGDNSDLEAEAGSPSPSRPTSPAPEYDDLTTTPYEVASMDMGVDDIEPEAVDLKLDDEQDSELPALGRTK